MSLRKLCCLLLTALWLYLPGRAVQAAAVPAPDDSAYLPQVLELLAGDWYDGDGQLVLSLNDTYLNQCPVTGLHGLAGGMSLAGGTLNLVEAAGPRDLSLSWRVNHDLHDYVIFDHLMLHKKDAGHFETVDGAYLGMTRPEVLSCLGQPNEAKAQRFQETFNYKARGLTLKLVCGYVITLTLYPGGTARLGHTGLKADSPLEDFYQAYGWTYDPAKYTKGIHQIDQTGENFFFMDYPQNITLSIYNT